MAIEFGMKIKVLRKDNKLTQQELADQIGVTKSAISAYENNTAQPSNDVLVKIVKLFNVYMDYMFGLDTDDEIVSRKYVDITELNENQKIMIYKVVKSYGEMNNIGKLRK